MLVVCRYADRAKAIPVNATKNDESEVIEKLNKEIQALRKKLEGQGDGGGGVSSHEARLMEERCDWDGLGWDMQVCVSLYQ